MLTYLAPIDPHVHLRGAEYPDYNFLKLGFRDALVAGLCAVGEQPNPKPELTSLEAIAVRLEQAAYYSAGTYHWIHIGMTNDMQQNERSLQAVINGVYRLRSDKTFNTHSTGNMGILEANKRREVYELKGRLNYRGVSCTHCENHHFYKCEFDPLHPTTHSLRQDEESELKSVEETLKNAHDTRFQGTVYICHASSPLTIDYVNAERKKLPFAVVLEETWHHMFLNADEDYPIHGNLVKMNPPLRSKRSQEAVLERVLRGKIDVIGSDHAPHPRELKLSYNSPSGIPALPFWPKGIELLRRHGIHEEVLELITFHNANRIFNLNFSPHSVEVSYRPERWQDYGWNPFSRIDGTDRTLDN